MNRLFDCYDEEFSHSLGRFRNALESGVAEQEFLILDARFKGDEYNARLASHARREGQRLTRKQPEMVSGLG
jgi:hypothetical protein